MFSRLFALLPVAAFVAVAAAAPGGGSNTLNECNTGDNYCCNSAFPNDTAFGGILGGALVGLNLEAALTCNPIDVIIGLGSNSCAQQPACCNNVNQNGLVNIACTPINLTA